MQNAGGFGAPDGAGASAGQMALWPAWTVANGLSARFRRTPFFCTFFPPTFFTLRERIFSAPGGV
jgi:hypothetical protein